MGIQTVTKKIDDLTVIISSFPAREGLQIQTRLVKLVAPSLCSLMDAVDSKDGKVSLQTDINMTLIKGAIEELAKRLDEDEVLSLILALFHYVKVDGKELDETAFDLAFASSYFTLYKVIWEVILVNRFFGRDGIGKATQSLKGAVAGTVSSKPGSQKG